jgi:ribonuclease BN (tRNA processing enzyme)
MAERILTAYEVDIKNRTNGPEHSNRNGYKVNAHDIKPGLVYKDQNVAVKAFAVPHGDLQAYGYRFETPDRTIVISGDTKPSEAIVENCHGCDVLVHEVYTQASFNLVSPEWKQYRLAYHTSSKELGEIATKAKPGLLNLTHRANPGCGKAPSLKRCDVAIVALIEAATRHWDNQVQDGLAPAHNRASICVALVKDHAPVRVPISHLIGLAHFWEGGTQPHHKLAMALLWDLPTFFSTGRTSVC